MQAVKLLNWRWTNVNKEAKKFQCNTSHLKCNIFTGCIVLSVKIYDELNEWLKTKFQFQFCSLMKEESLVTHFKPFYRTLSVKSIESVFSINLWSINSSLTLRFDVIISFITVEFTIKINSQTDLRNYLAACVQHVANKFMVSLGRQLWIVSD